MPCVTLCRCSTFRASSVMAATWVCRLRVIRVLTIVNWDVSSSTHIPAN